MNKIRGKERRKLKKEINKIKSFIKNFWRYYEMQKDMVEILGGQLITKKDAERELDKANKKIKEIEIKLNDDYFEKETILPNGELGVK